MRQQLALSRTRWNFGDKETTKGDPAVTACAMNEAHHCDNLMRFMALGQVVFHIAAPLREAFLRSDLGDACGTDLKFPFPSFYLHLGADLGLMFNDGRARLEGAMLQHVESEGGLRISLVGELTEPPAHWGLRGFESFFFYLTKEQMEKPLLEAVEERLRHESRDPNTIRELSDWSDYSDESTKSIQDSWHSHSLSRELNLKNLETTRECMLLVANALLYLSQYPQDVEESWQEGAPKGHREKFDKQDAKGREKTLSRARSEGFTRIKKVGRLFERELASEDGDSPSPHLRRAHLRRQAYGPKLTLRRLVWIRAVRVLGGTQRERPYLMADDAPQPGAAPTP
jgi:hypothetical protein